MAVASSTYPAMLRIHLSYFFFSFPIILSMLCFFLSFLFALGSSSSVDTALLGGGGLSTLAGTIGLGHIIRRVLFSVAEAEKSEKRRGFFADRINPVITMVRLKKERERF